MTTICRRWKTNKYIVHVLVLVLGLASSWGCASSHIQLNTTQSIPEGEGVVFGQLKMISEGKVRKSFTSIFGESMMSILIVPDNSSQGTYFPLKEAGFFFWHLPPGGFTIFGFEGRTNGFSIHSVKGSIFAHFEVIPNAVTYVGTLTLVFRGSRYVKLVEDEYETAVEEFQSRFTTIQKGAQKKLMVLEERK